jgi:hypothetical protein
VKGWIEGLSLSGRTLRLTARDPLPADAATLVVATAIRVFERFGVFDAVVLVSEHGELRLTRPEVERLLAPDGFPARGERGRWPQILARAVQRYTTAPAGGGATA